MLQNIRRSFTNTVYVVLCLGLAACGSDYTIDNPVKDSINTDAPSFTVSYSSQPESLPKMTLNGLPVEQFFTAGATSATGNGADFSNYFLEGYNAFHVDPPGGPQVRFIYDTKGPKVVILGAELNGGTATISGMAVDELGVSSMSVNGVDINVDDELKFTVDVPETDIYTYSATDTLNHTSTTLYAALGLDYDPSLTVKVNQDGLNVATAEIVNALNGMDINSLIAGSELYNGTWKGLFGETYGPSGFIRNMSLSAQEFNLDLNNGNNADFDGVISNLHAAITLRSYNGFLPPLDINIGATVGPLNLSGNLGLGVVDQMPDVEISDFAFSIGAIDFDGIGSVGDAILSGITTGLLNLLNGVVSNAVENLLNDAIPEMLANVLQDAYTIRITDALASHDMAMAANISAITTAENELYAALSGSVIPATPDLDIPQPLAGTLFTADPLPAADLGTGDFAVSINTNVINQTLASAHSVGLTHMNMSGTSLQFGLPRDDSLGGETMTHRLLINNLTPATVEINEVGGNATITMNVYGLEVASESKKTDGLYSNDVAARVDASIPISIGVDDDNTLAIGFPAPPEVIITGFRLGEGSWLTSGINELANDVIADSFGAIVEELVKPIANIKIPAFECLAFTVDGVDAVGGTNSHLNIAGTLTKISDACDVEIVDPPRVAYGRGVGSPLTCASDEEYDAGLCYEPCRDGYNGVGPVCWKQDASYGRGVGTIATRCGAGKENDAGLCYPVCRDGYNGVGPVCWSTQSLSYGRGVGTIPENIWTGRCPSGKENDAGLCYPYCREGYNGVGPVCWLENASYGRGVGTIPTDCGPGNERDAGLCYPECRDGYHGVGPVCWTNDSLSYGRGVGSPIHTCRDGMEKDGLLCYEQCQEGYNGIGPVCWPE
ncbi:MAG: hypothetical protein MI867_00510 [Pseudomonadales bacterium]|nr:hypothetical protein [Pseudomonadales bacterium]